VAGGCPVILPTGGVSQRSTVTSQLCVSLNFDPHIKTSDKSVQKKIKETKQNDSGISFNYMLQSQRKIIAKYTERKKKAKLSVFREV
jgi:hypothetical protein